MTITASSMIIRSLNMIGEKAIGATLTSAEQTAYLPVLVAAMASWGLEPLNSYAVQEDSFSLTAGTIAYPIGPGTAWNVSRPSSIVGAFVRDSSDFDSPVNVLDEEGYRRLPLKSTSGNTYPTDLWYDAGYTGGSGIATITLYPAPSASLTLYIHSPKKLQTFLTINDPLVLPPGYQRMIESNMAIELAPGYVSVSPEVLKIAKESRATIQRANAPERHMRLDSGAVMSSRGGGSILTGP